MRHILFLGRWICAINLLLVFVATYFYTYCVIEEIEEEKAENLIKLFHLYLIVLSLSIVILLINVAFLSRGF